MCEDIKKCSICISKYDYKTSSSCRYCRWNKEDYWDRDETKMIQDNYRYTKDNKDSNIPF